MVKITVDISTVRRWVINSRDSGRNMDVNDPPLCERPIRATHDLNMQNFDKQINDIELRDLRETSKRVERKNQSRFLEKEKILHHGNARPDTFATSAAVWSIGYEVVPYTPYSQDLAPSDFWLFGVSIKNISKPSIATESKKLVQRCLRCIEREWG
jgi:hypothetical protein